MLKELDDSDWAQGFGDESYGNTDKTIEDAPPNSGLSLEPFGREDVARIVRMKKEDGDYAEITLAGIFKLKDGRYAAVTGGCDTTGWDCQASNRMVVSKTLKDAIWLGLCDYYREFLYPEKAKKKQTA